jgi:ABC-type uncharacterized transport system substrate-binding protein
VIGLLTNEMAMNKAGWSSILVAPLVLVFGLAAEAQQPNHVPVIGFFRSGSALSVAAEREAFLQALKRLGYMDGKNVTIKYRYAEGKTERWPELISDLVNIKVDIIVTRRHRSSQDSQESDFDHSDCCGYGW